MSSERRGETFVMKADAAPPIDFTTFLMGLASTALIHLGKAPDPDSGQIHVDLALARETLELLTMLRGKTRGNLTSDEERLFATMLADLQLQFVEASRR